MRAVPDVVTSESATLDRERFKSLWARCRTDHGTEGADAAFDVLYRYYSERCRHYHTPDHIEHCLRQFDAAADLMDEPDAVEMALWFHDAIYEIEADDNEARSAGLFEELAGGTMPGAFKRRVRELIMVTTHQGAPASRDEGFIVDIDLSSFGLPWDEFLRDSAAVRAEFGDIDDATFYPRQLDFMKRLLDRPGFCFTEFFRDRHGARAHRNIRRTIEAMEDLD